MPTLISVYKQKGETPLHTVTRFKKNHPEYADEPIGYAGRLDPLAHGVLLLMIGEETTKQRERYLNLPKEYEFEAVFGVATDTYDALGIISHKEVIKKLDDFRVKDLMTQFIKTKLGKQTQQYPPFSSKTVYGKALFQWAKGGRLDEIEIPTREIEIYNFQLLEIQTTSAEKLKQEIMKQIDSVSGDFRQETIKQLWNSFFTNQQNTDFQIARFRIACSSGTYIRSLVNELGKQCGTGAIALDIIRTKVGEYHL